MTETEREKRQMDLRREACRLFCEQGQKDFIRMPLHKQDLVVLRMQKLGILKGD